MKAIKYYTLFILIVFFSSVKPTSAAVINCEVDDSFRAWATMNTDFELNITQVNPDKTVNIMVGPGVDDYTILYTIANVNLGNISANCIRNSVNITPELKMYYTMFSSNQGPAVSTFGTDVIYPTSVPGIGISVVANQQGNAPISLYPNARLYNGTAFIANGFGFWATIRIWKIPGTLPVSVGPISFTGPTVGQLLRNPGDTFTSSDTSRLWDGNSGWIASSRRLIGGFVFMPMTCNLTMQNQTVNMGVFDLSRSGAMAPAASEWKDVSFRFDCPAYGYGGGPRSDDGYGYPNSVSPDSTITANTGRNSGLRIQVIPRTPVVDATRGIVALRPGGAEGYGLQLAWGDSSTLGSGVPANPVIFNSWILANSINPAYSATTVAVGSKPYSYGDGMIKMAARYARTSGPIVPGPANTAVEVIAEYQ